MLQTYMLHTQKLTDKMTDVSILCSKNFCLVNLIFVKEWIKMLYVFQMKVLK